MSYKQDQNSELINLKPVSNGQRNRVVLRSKEITFRNKNIPNKNLLKKYKRSFGINNQGRRTCETKIKGHKKKYRIIDFKRDKINIPGIISRIEYDPFRTANIALVKYVDGEYKYILAAKNMFVGQNIFSGKTLEDCILSNGNSTLLKFVPSGRLNYNLIQELNFVELQVHLLLFFHMMK